MARGRFLLAATALLALLAVPSAAAAQRADTVIAFSDSRSFQSLEVTEQVLASQRRQVCKRAGRPRKMSLRRARRSVNRYLRRNVKRRALRRLARSRQTRTARRAESFAVASLGAGSPGAALAALLIAERKAPRSGRYLISASALLAPLGRANEAIAFAKAGERKARRAGRREKLTPFGIPQRAFALNARGYALITLGSYAPAVKALRRAARSEPLFTEPRRNLAAAYLCQGRAALAAQTYRRAQRRQELGETTGGSGGVEERYPPERVFDLSHGVEAQLPPIVFPQTPEAAVAAFPAIRQQHQDRFQEAQRMFDLANSALEQVSTPRSAAGSMRWADIWNALLDWEILAPGLVADRAAYRAQAQRLLEFPGRHFAAVQDQRSACNEAHPADGQAARQCLRDWCVPRTAEQHAQWLSDVRRLDGAMRDWAGRFYRRQSGLAANFADEASRDTHLFHARQVILGDYAVLLLGWGLETWSSTLELLVRDECVGSPDGEGGETGGHGLPSVPACPEALQTVNFRIKLGPFFSFSVNCEQVGVRVSKGPLTPFGQVNYKFTTGDTTVYAGVRGELPFAAAHTGIYVTFDSGFNLSDLGARAGHEGRLAGGPISVSGGGSSFDWSFAPALL